MIVFIVLWVVDLPLCFGRSHRWIEHLFVLDSNGFMIYLNLNWRQYIDEMHSLGWGLSGEAWRWRRRSFAWGEELVGECVELLTSVVLQVNVEGRWIWKIHSSLRYTVSRAYNILTLANHDNYSENSLVLWLKAVPCKVSLFAWHLLLNRVHKG